MPKTTVPSPEKLRTMRTSSLVRYVAKYEAYVETAESMTTIMAPFVSKDSLAEIRKSLTPTEDMKTTMHAAAAEIDKRVTPRWNAEELMQQVVEAGKKIGFFK